MQKRKIVIKSEQGFHVRPASVFVSKTKAYKSDIKIRKNNDIRDGRKLIQILTLEIECGDEVELIVDGVDEELAIEALEDIIASA